MLGAGRRICASRSSRGLVEALLDHVTGGARRVLDLLAEPVELGRRLDRHVALDGRLAREPRLVLVPDHEEGERRTELLHDPRRARVLIALLDVDPARPAAAVAAAVDL